MADPTPTAAQFEARAADLAKQAATTVLTAPAGTEPTWAKPAVAILSLVLFAGMLVVAYATNDETMKTLLGGAVISMATTASGYYLGSSAGSARKTEIAAGQTPPPAA